MRFFLARGEASGFGAVNSSAKCGRSWGCVRRGPYRSLQTETRAACERSVERLVAGIGESPMFP